MKLANGLLWRLWGTGLPLSCSTTVRPLWSVEPDCATVDAASPRDAAQRSNGAMGRPAGTPASVAPGIVADAAEGPKERAESRLPLELLALGRPSARPIIGADRGPWRCSAYNGPPGGRGAALGLSR